MAGGELQGLALHLVMDWLPTQDVVSVGQVCRRWRQLAKDPYVWRHRHAPDLNRAPEEFERGKFWRVVQFAPFVRKMSVEQPERRLGGKWTRFFEQLSNEISVKPRGLRIRFGLEGEPTPPWVHRMLRRLGPHLQMLEVENPGPEDEAVIRSLVLSEGPGPRTLHMRTWTDQLHGVEAWPVGEQPALDVLHISLTFAGGELLRVFGRAATRLELETKVDDKVITEPPATVNPRQPFGFRRYRPTPSQQVHIWQLVGGHVRELALLRARSHDGHDERYQRDQCAKQKALLASALPEATVTCSACEGTTLCRC